MHVELLYHTPPRARHSHGGAPVLRARGRRRAHGDHAEERVRSVLSTIMGSGHFSTLEHASYTFAVDGVSRALTHQLVRHRIASFNQQSQRYVRFADGVATVKPESVAESEEASAVFDQAIAAAGRGVREAAGCGRAGRGCALPLAERGRDEDRHHHERARAAALLLPALLQPRQWEIRDMAHRMLELARPTAPFIFLDAGAPCVGGTCPEGKMTCGNPYPRVKRG